MMKLCAKVCLMVVTVILLTMSFALAEECRHDHMVDYSDEAYHGEKCEDCGEVIWRRTHAAKCNVPGVCVECGVPYSGGEQSHSPAEGWQVDDTGHWLKCSICGEGYHKEAHFAVCYSSHACTRCGYKKDFAGSEVKHSLYPWFWTNIETHRKDCKWCFSVMEIGYHTRACDGDTCLTCYGEYSGGNVQHQLGADGLCTVCGSAASESTGGSGSSGNAGGSGLSGSMGGSTPSESAGDASWSGSTGSSTSSGSTGGSTSSAAKPVASVSYARPAATLSDIAPEAMRAPMPAFYEDGLPRALISAPRTGRATLRETASTSGKALGQFMDGTVVTVLGGNGEYTEVSIGGKRGYVLTTALEMVDMAQRPLGEGVLIAQNIRNVSVRSGASIQALKVAAWPTGTEAVVWSISENGQWYEIEAENARVWIYADYLNITRIYDDTVQALDGTEA